MSAMKAREVNFKGAAISPTPTYLATTFSPIISAKPTTTLSNSPNFEITIPCN